MESAAIRGAGWVVGKALSPLSGGLVEAWVATTELEPNIKALKMELLNAQAILHGARRREIDNPALVDLLQMLRGLGYLAEDVLDELDYFRIQDELEDTSEAIDDRGCARNLVRDVRHAATAAAKQLGCASSLSTAPGSNDRAGEKSCKCVRRIASRARTTVHTFGKRFLCSSHVPDDSKHVPTVPKLKFDRVDVSRRMKCITDELKPLCAKVSTILGLEFSGSVVAKLDLLGSSHGIGNAASTTRTITTSQALEPTLYGRDPQKNTIIEDITKGEYIHRDLNVIPIVGPGGIGKTTLTQYIYNNKTVKDHFQIRVWVCVSLDFSVYKLTKEIFSSIPKAEDEKNDIPDNEVQNLDQLQKLIEKRLKNRRFLLVLDDIWKYGNEDEWNRFLVPFKKVQGNGDIVLVTTRFLEVAEMVKRGNKLLQLEGLQPKDYWSLFIACVFDETNRQYIDKNLLEIGKNIVKKLKGSPLAAKTVGSLLRKNLTVDIWTRVLESREWELQTSNHDIMSALKLSYDYLPFHLQQCFSFCALFPEDYKFESEELIHFWIGLDILHPSHTTKRIEDVGYHSLNDLVNYGFFKKETDDSGTNYVMHDLLHDLALNVSSHECLHIASSSPRDIEIAPSIYHMSISISSRADSVDQKLRKGLEKIKNIIKFENLRTLMLFGSYDVTFVRIFNDLFKNAKSLRVVFLSTMYYHVESLLHNFFKLFHLRYMRLLSRKYGCKEHLPRFISRFYQLRVLDIQHWYGSHSLLGDMAKLLKLRHFISNNEEFHSNIYNVGKLHSLQELQRFEVRKKRSGFELRELGELEELGGSLGIYNLENALPNEAHEAKLSYKNRLQKLTLMWKKNPSTNPAAEDQVLESLCPHNNIHELCIDGHGGSTCPTWLGANLSTRGLEALCLDSVDWESLPPLGELYLVRENGEEYFGCIRGSNFHNLKRLELIGLPKFRRWVANEVCPWYYTVIEDTHARDQQEVALEVEEEVVAEEVAAEQEEDDGLLLLPAHLSGSLKYFSVERCPKLILIAQAGGAGGGGLQAMRSLEKIGIYHCPKFLSAYKDSDLSSCCPFPSSLGDLFLYGRMEGMDTLVPLSNLTSLQELNIWSDEELNIWSDEELNICRWDGLLPLLTQGQLTTLEVHSTNFFAGWDPICQEQPSSKLHELRTGDIAGVFAQPICRLLAPSLTELSLHFNKEVERFTKQQEEALSLLTSLQQLWFWWCDKLRCLPSGLRKLTSLERLHIDRCPVMRSLPKNGLPSSLQVLSVVDCIKLRFLPAGLHKLINLKRLEVRNCPAIRSLPKNGLPSSLQVLDVSRCENEKLKQQCRRLVGTIPLIRL
ncbi:disease resistance protein RGA2-like [Lolium rigidum]|uniref:disease resistance protein RGA2-like n=1 Tax=Lolium rigidum TaxID=89674 RepID=UPI001F5D8250|nr:disease resistance protein RGA2-like [Lolium rigidum]